jgi:hypothetical protein
MTTDLLVTSRYEGGRVYEARAIKYDPELKKPWGGEKLEIERRYVHLVRKIFAI